MIEFSNPAALWLLTLIIPIVLLYLLKRKRSDVTVPSLLVWRKAVEDSRAQTPFQRLRSNLLLFLQILIVTLITALLSEPHVYSRSQQVESWILVIDTSAGMQSTDEKPDRFAVAREKVQQVLDTIPAHDEVMLISFSVEASVLQPPTANHELIRTRLQTLKPDDVAGDWDRLSLILRPLLRRHPRPRIVIASDFARCPREFQSAIPFDSLAVGQSGDNVAVTRASVKSTPENPTTQVLFYQISNLSVRERKCDAEIYLDGELADAFELSLGPSESIDRSRELTVLLEKKIEIRVATPDALALDNDFILFAEPARPISVQASYKHPFLDRALRVIPLVTTSADADITILRQSEDSPEHKAGLVFFSAPESAGPAQVVQWNRSHPTLRFVDAGVWRFSHCRSLQPPPEADILLETDHGCAAYAEDLPNQRTIVLGFDLDQSDLVTYAGFPIFLQNSLGWIEEGMRKPLPTLTGNQSRKEGPVESNGMRSYLNFADADESRIAPQRPAAHAAFEKRSARVIRSLAPIFLILLIGIVILEWWAFHRRMDSN